MENKGDEPGDVVSDTLPPPPPPLLDRPKSSMVGSPGILNLKGSVRSPGWKENDGVERKDGETPGTARTHRNRIMSPTDDSDVLSDESGDLPGAHHVSGVNAPLSSRSFVSIKSDESHDNTAGLTSAIPINDENAEGGKIDDDVKKKIKAEAKKEAEKKVKEGAVPAAARTEEDERRDKETRLRRQLAAGLVIVVLFLGGVATAVYFLVFHTVDPEPAVTESPTVVPTIAPTPRPPIPEQNNDLCESAIGLEEEIGVGIFGTTVNASFDDVDECEVVDSNGLGVWYRLAGNDTLMTASTCDNTRFDTQISVFRGECGKLQCVSGNDQISCGVTGDQSQVAWYGEPETDYYIYVHGTRERTGQFRLAVEPMVDNDICDKAIGVEVGGEPLFGSTRSATNDLVEQCGGAREQTTGGVWYSAKGTGETMSATLITAGVTEFGGQISVFTGDSCAALECVDGGLIGFISWPSVSDQNYFILVHGQVLSAGDFRLELGTLEAPPEEEVGNVCDDTENAPLIEIGSSVDDSTVGRPVYEVESCGDGVFSRAPGFWYRVVASTDGALIASTCSDKTDFDTQISVFTTFGYCGDVYDLFCVDGNDNGSGDCDDGSSVTWFTSANQTYYILVHGWGDRVGQFELTVKDFVVEVSDECDDAISVFTDGNSVLGVTEGARNSTVSECGAIEGVPGVWYIAEGTGQNITASTCREDSPVASTITVFTGLCDTLQCVDGVTVPCGRQSLVSFRSFPGVLFYIFVQDAPSLPSRRTEEFSEVPFLYPSGSFVLTVEETPQNDLCPQAIPLAADGSELFASTRSATNTGSQLCFFGERREQEDEPTFGARGIWYTVEGDGRDLTASTCSAQTNFGARVSVFTGDCGSLTCVRGFGDFCSGFGMLYQWTAEVGVTYYIYVSGDDFFSDEFQSFGNFGLTISGGNDFCDAYEFLFEGDFITGSTVDATIDDVPTCDATPYVISPGVWYQVRGTGSTLVASTCHDETNFETSISIFTGSGCGSNLQCTNQTSVEICGSKSIVSWESFRSTRYYILVHGYGVGDFGLSIGSEGSYCFNAANVNPQFPPFEDGIYSRTELQGDTITGNVLDGLEVAAAACDNDFVSPGQWFVLDGEGTNVDVTLVCEDFPNAIFSVFTGDCDGNLQCVNSRPDCGMLTFSTEFGSQYYILLQAVEDPIITFFQMIVRRSLPVLCSQAAAVNPTESGDYAFHVVSTLAASNDEFFGPCDGTFFDGFGAAWYGLVGNGQSLTASTCNNQTNFDTQITIYSGACGNLTCVAGNDNIDDGEPFVPTDDFAGTFPQGARYLQGPINLCSPFASEVTWEAEMGTIYYVLVHPFPEDGPASSAPVYELTIETAVDPAINPTTDPTIDPSSPPIRPTPPPNVNRTV